MLGVLSPLVQATETDMRSIVAEGTVDAATYGRNKIAQAVGARILPFPDRVQIALQERVFEASRSTLNRLVGNAMENLAVSADSGLGIVEAADALSAEFSSMREFELRRIARTELNRAQQLAAVDTEKELGVEFHQWSGAQDARERESHLAQEGEIVRVGEPFSNGLTHPGDPAGDVSEIINCRCIVVPFIVPAGMRAPVDLARFYESDLQAA